MDRYKVYTFTDTFTCGHECEIEVGGYSEEYARDRATERFGGLCPACQKAENERKHKEEAEIAEKEAIDLGLPKLVGTDKQIRWALSLRRNFYKYVEKLAMRADDAELENIFSTYPGILANHRDKYLEIDDEPDKIVQKKLWVENKEIFVCATRSNIHMALYKFLKQTISSDWYIKNRDYISYDLAEICGWFVEYFPLSDADKEEKRLADEIELEKIVYPINFNDTLVTISYSDSISVESPKDEEIIKIVKSLGYRWYRPAWEKRVYDQRDRADDMIAELANKLLCAGYGVKFDVENFKNVQDMAKNGDFVKSVNKWVTYSVDSSDLVLNWAYDDKLYVEAKRLAGAYWKKYDGMHVPVTSYTQVLDFAEEFDFKVSDKAMQAIESYKKMIMKENIAKVSKEPKGLLERPNVSDIERELLDD